MNRFETLLLSRREALRGLFSTAFRTAIPPQTLQPTQLSRESTSLKDGETVFVPPFIRQDLIRVGFGEIEAERILTAYPVLMQAEATILNQNSKTGVATGIPAEFFAAVLNLENGSKMQSNSPYGPYQITSRQYASKVDSPTDFLFATFEAAEFLTVKGHEIGINPHVEAADINNHSIKTWGILGAYYNGLTEPVRVWGRNVYGNPETDEHLWPLSGYTSNKYQNVAQKYGYPLLWLDGQLVDTEKMPVRITNPYPTNLSDQEAHKYFTVMEHAGLMAIIIQLIEAQKLAADRERLMNGVEGGKMKK